MSRWEDLQRPMPHPAAVAPTASQAQCKYQFLPSYLVTCLSLQERLEPEQRLGSHGLSTQETLSAHSAPAAVLRALSPISLSPRLTSHLLSVPSPVFSPASRTREWPPAPPSSLVLLSSAQNRPVRTPVRLSIAGPSPRLQLAARVTWAHPFPFLGFCLPMRNAEPG